MWLRIESDFTCLYTDPANALVEALSNIVLLDFSLTHVTADAVSDALTSACTSILLPVILPERAVVDARTCDWASINALFCDDTPKWLPLATLRLTSPMLVAPIREMASTLVASWLRELLSSSSKSNLKPSRVVDTAQPARHNETGTTP